MAPVALRNVNKSYGATAVIHGVSIDIADGEFVALGRALRLREIDPLAHDRRAGADHGGEIEIGGRVVNDLEPKDRDIAMVFQNYALYPHMSVEKNMGFSLEHRGASKAAIAERVNWAAEILGLTTLLKRLPGQLSGGQRQRVAMGRAIVRDPQVFLFDEPLSNLDAKLRVLMRGEIKTLHGRLKTTTVYVTHDQVEAMTMAHKIVVMNAGRVEQIGAPLELFDRPANLFVAGFIGSPAMNLIPGTVVEGRFVGGDKSALPCPAGAGGQRWIGSRVRGAPGAFRDCRKRIAPGGLAGRTHGLGHADHRCGLRSDGRRHLSPSHQRRDRRNHSSSTCARRISPFRCGDWPKHQASPAMTDLIDGPIYRAMRKRDCSRCSSRWRGTTWSWRGPPLTQAVFGSSST
jgi:multiple sugar transport system ATP-binding protein